MLQYACVWEKPPRLGASKPVPEEHSTYKYPQHPGDVCLK